jgi:hypothetical protein
MTKGAKIALGCAGVGCLFVAGAAAVVVFGIGAGAHWLKGKTASFVDHQERIDEFRRKADASPFERPADGVVAEDRLLKFLEVRKRVFAVYEKHQPYFEALKGKKDADLSDLTAAFSVLGEVQLAQAQARAELGMSEAEYAFLVQSVYQSAWAAAVSKDTGKEASEAVSEAMKQVSEAMGKGLESARREGVPGAGEITDESLREAQEQVRKAAESMKDLDAPPANVALFRKHEAEIKKYAMHGLELVGL